MRQLRVVGLGDDHETVILEDPIRHERFTVAGDERLRAAARGDVRRLGQMEIEVSSPLRPRDIQQRVRAGESVDEVAAAAGVSTSHVERFAYPVLLERARVAEISRRAHPVLPTDPTRTDGRTLGEIVAATFAARGQDLDDARWDAHKGDDAQWVVTLSWQAGRSDNVARWSFRPGSAGGTVDPRDDPARELLGREPVGGGPRRVDATAPEPTPEAEPGDTLEETPALAVSGDTAPARRASPSTHAAATHAASGTASTRRAERGSPRRGASRGERRGSGSTTPATPPAPPAPPAPPTAPAVPAASDDQVPTPRTARNDAPAAESPAVPAEAAEGTRRGKRSHPIVPSWEDVLLGTRSPRS
ncbi:septation protein SepH [Actinomycetospora aeridis]|uniref:Septation protein SepH n=1 Tax=Actinomycetospora aeridis TaxID=3129231 RepID=A0ABU8MXN7_9PSEU